jgi:hypothetical protein
VGLIGGLLGAAIGVGAGILPQFFIARVAPPKEPLAVRLDPAGPYVILATKRAAKDYAGAIEAAKALHPKADRVEFDPVELAEVGTSLRRSQPRYALVFIEPDELDVNFAWRWLETTSRLDEDPFVDVRTGFVTGSSPEAVAAFIVRTAAAVDGRLKLPGALVDDLGPPEVGDQKYFKTLAGAELVPALGARLSPRSVVHGKGCFPDGNLDSLQGAGVVHFGGHGHPDRIDDGLTAAQVPKLKLAPCVVFNGACYTGVTGRWYDTIGPGSAARILFGDPALVVCDGFAAAPFNTAVEGRGDELRVTATVANPGLKSTFTDTYYNDLNPQAPFNDRALVVVDLPSDWPAIGQVDVVAVKVGRQALPHRLVGHAIESDRGIRRLHVQVDVLATAFQSSAFRVVGATVEIVARRPS